MALPTHTNDRIQPLDGSMFTSLKRHISLALSDATSKGAHTKMEYRVSGLKLKNSIMKAYDMSMKSINLGLRKSGLWTLHANYSL